MDDKNEAKITEDSEGSERIEVKIASASNDVPSVPENNVGDHIGSMDIKPIDENPSTRKDELVPPPSTESRLDSLDEGALEPSMPPVEHDTSEAEVQQLAPVVAPPSDGIQQEILPSASSSTLPSIATPDVTQQAISDHPHRNNKKLAIAITLAVGILLAFVAVYVYMSANENTKEVSPVTIPISSQSTEQSNQSDVDPATSEDVDVTTRAIEEAIGSLDDANDLAEDQLSDEALGL